jgi:hypothetical protein
MRWLKGLLRRPAVMVPLGVSLIAVSVGAYSMRGSAAPAPREYVPTTQDLAAIDLDYTRPPHVDPTPTPTFTPPPPPKPKPKPTPKPAGPSLDAFRRLGAWVDLYDATLDPEAGAADMAARGVRTLYVQTARWNKPDPASSAVFEPSARVEQWLHAGHGHGMKVVGWYLPAYDDMKRDVARTVAIATYRSSAGQRFDALGIDIEYKGQSPTLSAWNAGVLDHARRVRAAVGSKYPVAAIVPSPIAMEIRPTSWAGFPWEGLAAVSNVFMPMSYWSYRDDCPSKPEQCAYGYTTGNVERVRAWTKRPTVPVHIIGGVGDAITVHEVEDFVRGAMAVRAYGASLYDYRTTKSEFWAHLRKLNG